MGREVFKLDKRYAGRKAEIGRAMVKSQSAWSSNRYSVTRELWKAIWMPVSSFGSAVNGHNSKFWNEMDIIQREVGRYALGCQFYCAREFVEGEIGMSTMSGRFNEN